MSGCSIPRNQCATGVRTVGRGIMCEFDHHGHNVVVREWRDFDLAEVTGVTVDCDTCGVELAAFGL